jgi:hypothetical protein
MDVPSSNEAEVNLTHSFISDDASGIPRSFIVDLIPEETDEKGVSLYSSKQAIARAQLAGISIAQGSDSESEGNESDVDEGPLIIGYQDRIFLAMPASKMKHGM